MKKFTKFFSVLMALMLAMCFVSCSDDDDNSSSSSSSNTTASSMTVGSKYKGTMTASGQTVYIIVTVDTASTQSSQGYDSTFTTMESMGTTSGTYTVSGNTVSMVAPYMGTCTCTTSDNWNTLVGTSGWSGTLTKQ